MSLPARTMAGGVCGDDISYPISLYFTQNWIMINYDDSTLINADATFSIVSPAHSLSWVHQESKTDSLSLMVENERPIFK